MHLNKIIHFWHDESGLSIVEYSIAGSLVAAGMVMAFSELGTATSERVLEMCSNVDPNGECSGQ